MKSFKETIYFNREKESNWDIRNKAKNLKFENFDDLSYLGYELEMEVEICEDNAHKVFSINGTDISDKDIYI